MKSIKLKESYNNTDLHKEFIDNLRDYIEGLDEYTVTPPLFYVKENEKGFCVISDGGNGNNMKRFKVTIEDYKNKEDGRVCNI